MNKTKIEWCTHTWNPITGCKREPSCEYCYARKIHNRFYKYPFSNIVFHENRLVKPAKVKKPSVVFVGSMSDIEFWERDDTRKVIEVCKQNPHHTFMFLSKGPNSYAGFKWPDNTMQGLTVNTLESTSSQRLNISSFIQRSERPYLSIEPLLGFVNLRGIKFEKVIVGAQTGPGPIKPKKEWIDSVKRSFHLQEVFWKDNIKKYL